MDAVQRHVHQATIDVLVSSGFEVRLATPADGCCGALASHSGLDRISAAQSARLTSRFPGGDRIVVDSAGCGAHLKDLGGALGERVVDVVELLDEDLARLPEPAPTWVRPIVAVSDPCHLRHVQGLHVATRRVLGRYADVIEMDDDGLCCGAGGAFALLRPEEAAAIRDRKVASIDRCGADHVVAANPGCAMHLAGAAIAVSHPMQIMNRAIHDHAGGAIDVG
jgi:glycolate oxidase iron-sulfur subunit